MRWLNGTRFNGHELVQIPGDAEVHDSTVHVESELAMTW